MNSQTAALGSSTAKALDQLLEEITGRIQAGESVDYEHYATAYPEYADRLERLLPAMFALVAFGKSQPATTNDAASSSATPVSGVLGDFRILGELGRGGMGVVYEAEQISIGRRVALKVLPFASIIDERRLARFRNEVRAAGQLHHTNIVPIYAVGADRGVHFFAMQLVDGQTVAEMISDLRGHAATATPTSDPNSPAAHRAGADETERAALSTVRSNTGATFYRTVAQLGGHAAEALEHAHAHGVIHRDIKPTNLMVDARGTLYLTDFGLASIETDSNLTMTGDLLGTLRYMSPEQTRGSRVVLDHRTDVYSLGVTLYELLTLELAFDAPDRQQLLQMITDVEPRAPRRLNAAIPPDLETIVLKAMAKEPGSRYATAQDMADDLHRFLANKPIEARRPTLVDRTVMWSRRRPAVVRLLAASMLAATLLSGVTTKLIWNANQRMTAALEQAEIQRREAEARQQDAARSADELQAVIEFLTNDLIGAAAPLVDQQGDMTVKEALEKSAEQVDVSFAGQPTVQVAVYIAIGRSFQALGDFERSRQQFERACDVAHRELSPNGAESLSAEYNLARLHNIEGRLAEARQELEQLHARTLQYLGADHPLLVLLEYQSGNNARLAGRHDEAVERLQNVLEVCRRANRPPDNFTLAVMSDLAMAYWFQGDVASAERLAQEQLRIARRHYPSRDLRVIRAVQALARIPSPDRDTQAIVAARESVLAAFRVAYGNSHYKTIEAMHELARSYRDLGDVDRAVQLEADASQAR